LVEFFNLNGKGRQANSRIEPLLDGHKAFKRSPTMGWRGWFFLSLVAILFLWYVQFII